MRLIFSLLIAFALLTGLVKVCDAETNQILTVHGRLTFCNGNPCCRIWMVGTKRMLGVRESGCEVPDMPKDLEKLMTWDREIFADFAVEPLTPYKQGEMQMVRVLSASKIVVTEKDKIIVRKDRL